MTQPSDTPPGPVLMEPEAVAEVLGVSRVTVLKLIRKGRLRGVNVGTGTQRHTWQVSRADLDTYIANGGRR